ncbi:MAG: hypothetical protein OH338_05125 [Candidatus Parvarchaeota archaeon]|nr:hypothetical protein [Candidatus Parvarchaeum tengchongense]
MRDFVIKDFDKFLQISDSIDSPFKFYQEIGKETYRAWIWLRTAMISWEGVIKEVEIQRLKEHGFCEAEERETRKISLEDLL